uniref:Secreted protein n=1 Tax=Acrobeloides nanus TaxID=290746 RepID=A0A914CGI6_9BILA
MKLLSFVVLFVVVAIALGQLRQPGQGGIGGLKNSPFGGRALRHNGRSSSSSSEEHRTRPTGATAKTTTTAGKR